MTLNQINKSNLTVPLVNEDWLKVSIPLRNEEFHTLQFLKETKSNAKTDLVDNLINFKLNLFAGFLTVCFLCLAFKFLVVFYKKNFKEKQLKFAQLVQKFAVVSFSFSSKFQIAALNLFVLFFGQFLWFSTLLATSTIKTETVIVDTR